MSDPANAVTSHPRNVGGAGEGGGRGHPRRQVVRTYVRTTSTVHLTPDKASTSSRKSGEGILGLMKKALPLVVGGLMLVVGLVWTFQGLGYLSGSPMTGVAFW